MQLKKKKIQLIYCGGLNLKKKDQNDSGLKKWLKTMPELVLMAEIKPRYFVSELDGKKEHLGWQKLAEFIFNNYQKYDGFIVVNDAEKIQNAAVCLSFMLKNLGKPVIFTAEPMPEKLMKIKQKANLKDVLNIYDLLSIKANIINALQVINYAIPELGLMFGNKLIKATRSTSNKDKLNIFDSVNEPLGRVAFNISINKKDVKKLGKKMQLQTNFDENVVYLKVYPGFSRQVIEDLSLTNNGIILDFTDQNIVIDGLNKAKANDKAVVLFNKPARQEEKSHFISIKNILPDVLIIKLMWVLGQARDLPEVKKLLLSDISGEFIK